MNSEHLYSDIVRLNSDELAIVIDFIDALSASVETEVLEGSWLMTEKWSKAFLARLRAHHALNRSPLSTTQFESAFEGACESASWKIDHATSATQRFYDTTITVTGGNPKRISLKSTSASNMSKNSIHISKLTEAAWIQDVRKKADRRDKIIELFQDYRSIADCIIILRGFRYIDRIEYELVEIPSDLLKPIDDLSLADAQLGTIPVREFGNEPYMSVRIDRSDGKISLTGIKLAACIVHGRWKFMSRL